MLSLTKLNSSSLDNPLSGGDVEEVEGWWKKRVGGGGGRQVCAYDAG